MFDHKTSFFFDIIYTATLNWLTIKAKEKTRTGTARIYGVVDFG